jgi:hypothetical protein
MIGIEKLKNFIRKLIIYFKIKNILIRTGESHAQVNLL